jgi:hypothetical protein
MSTGYFTIGQTADVFSDNLQICSIDLPVEFLRVKSHLRACRKKGLSDFPFTASLTSSTIWPAFISTTRKRRFPLRASQAAFLEKETRLPA